jgi:serine-type D-Ala-D-Ala carboxypeptidase/endopeptidase (penicillin-binding protein 4)
MVWSLTRGGVGLLIGAMVCGVSVWAQDHGVGCDGAVVLKAGRGGPCTELAKTIAGLLDDPRVARDHWGIVVEGMDGAPIYSLNEGQLFQPASNAKLFTTAAAMALLGPKRTFETKVVAQGVMDGPAALTGDLMLVGGGDANLSGRALPYVTPTSGQESVVEIDPLRYLAALADEVAASGLKTVSGDVVGDDTWFWWEPYGSDWAIDDAVWGYGAPVSALSVNDNQNKVTITPGSAQGDAASVSLEPTAAYYTIDAKGLVTGKAKSANTVHIERMIGSRMVRMYGSIAVNGSPDVEEIAIEDPAEYGAMVLKSMLEARGVTVAGVARAKHAISSDDKSFLDQVREPIPYALLARAGGCAVDADGGTRVPTRVLASHQSVAMAEDVVVTNKVSQNLHAEILLRQMGSLSPSSFCRGSIATGAQVVRAFLLHAGIDGDDFVFYDGSGLSGHNLVTPRATARLLQYASGQPWFADWKSSLPVGGVDGSLEDRFAKEPLKGRVFAKTGTLGEARALSGYVECASGRTVIFSIMVGNHLPQTHEDRDAMDKVVAAIAAAN